MPTKTTAAKLIKQVVVEHQALVALDGNSSVPVGFPFAIQDDANADVHAQARQKLLPLVSAVTSLLPSLTDALAAKQSEPRKYKDMVKQVLLTRVLTYMAKSSVAIGSSLHFTTRTFLTADLLKIGLNSMYVELLGDSNAILQIKRIEGDDPYIFTWVCIVDGASVSRGTAQPLHKLITGLIKAMNNEAVMNQHDVQVVIQELANMRPTEKLYYWYLSNKNTAQHYRLFGEYRGASSCMSKQASYYTKTGSRQHPMDAYNDSPDWRLMFISEHSPEEITAMCDSVLDNPEAEDRLFDYPFLTRSLVLPTQLEESKHVFSTPYVFGKMYGLEKILRYLFEDTSGYHHLNSNPLVTHASSIAGGRIAALKTTNASYTGYYLLPYFDQANNAKLRKDADGDWFVSTYLQHEKSQPIDKRPLYIWKALYQSGVAAAVRAKTNLSTEYRSIDSCNPQTIMTILGEEDRSMRSSFVSIDIGTETHSVPHDWTVSFDHRNYLRADMIQTMGGQQVPQSYIDARNSRYKKVDGIGYFDMHNTLEKTAYAAVMKTRAPVAPLVFDGDATNVADPVAPVAMAEHEQSVDAILAAHMESIATGAVAPVAIPVAPGTVQGIDWANATVTSTTTPATDLSFLNFGDD